MNHTDILDKLNRGKNQRFFIVSGNEGLGKTKAALSRAIFLKDNYCIRENENILIISDEEIGDTLEKIKNKSARDNTFFSLLNNNEIEVYSKNKLIDKYFQSISNHGGISKRFCEADVIREIILDGINKVRRLEEKMNKIIVSQNINFLFDEILYIKEMNIASINEYQQINRKNRGRTIRRNSKARESIYKLYIWYCEYMNKSGLIDYIDKFNIVYNTDKKNLDLRYAHIIIDNVEKLTIKELTFIRSLLGELTYSNLILVKDTNNGSVESPWRDYFKRNKDISYFDDNKYRSINCNVSANRKSSGVNNKKIIKTNEVENIDKIQEVSKGEEIVYMENKIETLECHKSDDKGITMGDGVEINKNSEYIENYKYVDFKHNVSHKFAIDTSSYEEVILNPDTTSEIISNKEINKVPVYNEIAAGQPISINDEIEGVFNLPIYWLKGVQQPFILKIKGDSMINVDIEDGDYVVINKQTMANHNEIVAVSIDGEATLKRLWLRGKKAVLMPENNKYSPIEITEDNAYIIGKAVGLIKAIR
ncbi:MAG: transcriptional repressor LexA [Clostridium sp.]|uniref:transcriptional repressor LexA n=1 Tax=Clostridium sp. TaxID=1506 RepID=UPI0030465635